MEHENQITRNGYVFSINHYTYLDSYSTVEITHEYIPIGYFSSEVDTLLSVAIHHESEFESFVDEWLEKNQG